MKDLCSKRWSDNAPYSQGDPSERISAGPEWMPDRNLLKAEEPDAPDENTECQPVHAGCSPKQRLQCFKDTLLTFRDQCSDDREFLAWIARYFLRLKYKKLECIIRLDKSGINRSVKAVAARLSGVNHAPRVIQSRSSTCPACGTFGPKIDGRCAFCGEVK